MGRRPNCRRICCYPKIKFFKPNAVPLSKLEIVNLSTDELEAVRLADFENFYQEDAATQMEISRQTFGRIINSAHFKIADALINGKALEIDGGNVSIKNNLEIL